MSSARRGKRRSQALFSQQVRTAAAMSPAMLKLDWKRVTLALAIASLLLACGTAARAVPAFAAQTGQPCQQCHVGGFGPQLTAYGRNFKLNGYTQRSGPTNAPLAIMAVTSYVRTL